MQLEIVLKPMDSMPLSMDHQNTLSAAVYQAITDSNPAFGKRLHNSPQLKIFSVSPLIGHEYFSVMDQKGKIPMIIFNGPVSFRVASLDHEIISSFVRGIQSRPCFKIGDKEFSLVDFYTVTEPVYSQVMDWEPVGKGGLVTAWYDKAKKKHFYMHPALESRYPDYPTCEELIKTNLIHKWDILNEEFPNVVVSFQKYDYIDAPCDITVSIDRDTVKRRGFKVGDNGLIDGWAGVIRVSAPSYIQRMIWSTGLGQRNAMGFGLVDAL